MNTSKFSRRTFCSNLLGNGALLLGAGSLLASCGGEKKQDAKTEATPPAEATETAPQAAGTDPCTDFSKVEPSELEKRKALGYVEKSPIPENLCENCKLFVPGQADANCGGCQLFKGPVFKDAYCTYWADPAV
ncbi:high-potential iron-sulfur protein [Ravibacter arvi]|uniref:High-potential iron-sulfur protein n=1 Tax=Ravibacter arvi TaxID=2051041 RepID=A0ABP8M136_9BACT